MTEIKKVLISQIYKNSNKKLEARKKRDELRDLIVRDLTEAEVPTEIEGAINVAYDFIYESITKTLSDV